MQANTSSICSYIHSYYHAHACIGLPHCNIHMPSCGKQHHIYNIYILTMISLSCHTPFLLSFLKNKRHSEIKYRWVNIRLRRYLEKYYYEMGRAETNVSYKLLAQDEACMQCGFKALFTRGFWSRSWSRLVAFTRRQTRFKSRFRPPLPCRLWSRFESGFGTWCSCKRGLR